MNRILERRAALNMSQRGLAEAAGVSQKAISRYERGEDAPSATALGRLASALETTSDYLIGRVDDPRPTFSAPDLSPSEAAIIACLRIGDRVGAIRIIVNAPNQPPGHDE